MAIGKHFAVKCTNDHRERPWFGHRFPYNFVPTLFNPFLPFFYMVLAISWLTIPFEFPHVLYQGLTMYFFGSMGWRGDEVMASLKATETRRLFKEAATT